MPYITDSFNRSFSHGQDNLDVNALKSLLLDDVKTKTSKKAMNDDDPPEKVKARKVIEDLLAKLTEQDIGTELKELNKNIKEANEVNKQYYTKGGKKEGARNTLSMGNIVGLDKMVGDVVKSSLSAMHGLPSSMGQRRNQQPSLATKGVPIVSLASNDCIRICGWNRLIKAVEAIGTKKGTRNIAKNIAAATTAASVTTKNPSWWKIFGKRVKKEKGGGAKVPLIPGVPLEEEDDDPVNKGRARGWRWKSAARVIGDIMWSEHPTQALFQRVDMGRIVGNVISRTPVLNRLPLVGPALEGIVSFLTEPMINQLEYYQNFRQQAFRTEGIGVGPRGETTARESALQQYQLSEADIVTTGQKIGAVQKQQIRNWQRGIREASTLNRVTITGLNTAYLLGSSADETANLFADMHQNLQMGAFDLAHMSQSMLNVARQTGVSGDNLIRVARSAEQFTMTMRNIGTFTPQAGTNIMRSLAEASTTGTTQGMTRILQTLSTSILEPGNQGIQSLLLAGGGNNQGYLNQLIEGTAPTGREGFRATADALQNVANMFRGVSPGMASLQIRQMSQGQIGGIQELNLLIENLRRTGMTFAQQMDALQTMELTPQQRTERQQATTRTEISSYLATLGTNIGAGLDTAIQRLNTSDNEMATTLQRLIGTGNTAVTRENLPRLLRAQAQDINARLEGAVDALGNSLAPAGSQIDINRIEGVIQRGDADEIRRLLLEISAGNQLANRLQAASQEPISSFELLVKQLEVRVSKLVEGLLPELIRLLTVLVNWLTNTAIPWIEGTGIPWLQRNGPGVARFVEDNLAAIGIVTAGLLLLMSPLGNVITRLVSMAAAIGNPGGAGGAGATGLLRSLGMMALVAGAATGFAETGTAGGALQGLLTGTADPNRGAYHTNLNNNQPILNGLANPNDLTAIGHGALGGAYIGSFFGPAGIALGAAIGGLAAAFTRLAQVSNTLREAQERSTVLDQRTVAFNARPQASTEQMQAGNMSRLSQPSYGPTGEAIPLTQATIDAEIARNRVLTIEARERQLNSRSPQLRTQQALGYAMPSNFYRALAESTAENNQDFINILLNQASVGDIDLNALLGVANSQARRDLVRTMGLRPATGPSGSQNVISGFAGTPEGRANVELEQLRNVELPAQTMFSMLPPALQRDARFLPLLRAYAGTTEGSVEGNAAYAALNDALRTAGIPNAPGGNALNTLSPWSRFTQTQSREPRLNMIPENESPLERMLRLNFGVTKEWLLGNGFTAQRYIDEVLLGPNGLAARQQRGENFVGVQGEANGIRIPQNMLPDMNQFFRGYTPNVNPAALGDAGGGDWGTVAGDDATQQLQNLQQRAQELLNRGPTGGAAIQPRLSGITGAFADAEAETRRRQMVEAIRNAGPQEVCGDELESIEGNSEENVKQNNKVIALLTLVAKLLTSPKKKRTGGGDNQEDIYDETLFDSPLNTEWLASSLVDNVAIDVDMDRT